MWFVAPFVEWNWANGKMIHSKTTSAEVRLVASLRGYLLGIPLLVPPTSLRQHCLNNLSKATTCVGFIWSYDLISFQNAVLLFVFMLLLCVLYNPTNFECTFSFYSYKS